MNGIRPFDIALYGIFGLLAILSIVFISQYNPPGSQDAFKYGDRVVIWGTFDRKIVDDVFQSIADADDAFRVVQYEQIDPRSFDSELTNAIAEGRSPDLVVLTHEQLALHRAKLLPISYDTISERTFRDSYVDGAEVFARLDGIYALPFAVDPLMMYWNRDIFATRSLARPPTTWEQLITSTAPAITVRNASGDVVQSTLAFGEYSNVRYSKEVLLMLMLQAGSRMVVETDRGYEVGLNSSAVDVGVPPAESAVQFFTSFSNPNTDRYSWNRALPDDRSSFLGGDLALYFGYGSEALTLQGMNPNLNFDIAMVPQGSGVTAQRDYGLFYGLAVPRAAANAQGAFLAAQTIASSENALVLAKALSLAPVHRATIATMGGDNAFQTVINRSALITRGWLDPNPGASSVIFKSMIDDVVSNRERISKAVSDAVQKLSLIFR